MSKIKQKQTIKNAAFINSGILFGIAKDNYEKIKENKNSALVCILFSVIALEAFINELLGRAKMRHSNTLLLSSDEEKLKLTNLSAIATCNLDLRSQYMMARMILAGSGYEKEQNPYKDFNTLIALRNRIVHMQLDDFTFTRDKEREYPEMLNKLPIALVQKGLNASWISRIETPEMACWACNTVVDMIVSITEALPEGDFKEEYNFFVEQTFQKLP